MNAAAQLDQQPVPEGGAIFQREWLKFYPEAPKAFDQVILSWDLAYKDGESPRQLCLRPSVGPQGRGLLSTRPSLGSHVVLDGSGSYPGSSQAMATSYGQAD